jgi:4-hydroxybenzoate polyprenyltransferase
MMSMALVRERVSLYGRLTRLHRPIGTLLLLWPTYWALWMASDGLPEARWILIFGVGTLLMRSAGCAINDWADRDFDRHVARTKDRPLTSGAISSREALAVAGGLALAAGGLLFWLNNPARGLALLAVAVAVIYPFCKRFLPLPQAVLGIAFGMGIPMAFAAVQGSVPLTGWLLFAANWFWTIAYDTEYAMADREDDLRIGIRTSAITFGRHDVNAVLGCYVLALTLLSVIGGREGYGVAWMAGLAAAASIAMRHVAWIRGRDSAACLRAFHHNTWFGFAVFAGLVAQTWR